MTDWRDARMVPLAQGRFDLDDYIDAVIAMLEHLGPDTHVVAVCQPAVPVLAAVALMEADDHPGVPATMTLMGGPIDTRINPHRGEPAGRGEADRLVRAPRHHARALAAAGLHAARLSGASCSWAASCR